MQERLIATVRAQAAEVEVWERAEQHLLQEALRCRLRELGVVADHDVAVALMGVALLLAERAPEWGGDVRDCLGEIAQLGLALLHGETASPPPA